MSRLKQVSVMELKFLVPEDEGTGLLISFEGTTVEGGPQGKTDGGPRIASFERPAKVPTIQ